ncbi:MAG: glucose-6-phosphate dehydrogenase [Candidatus Peribacteraceae bacterium]
MFAAPSPFSLVLFGASGHLAQIKLYPALYILALKKRLPEQYAIVGFSRSAMDDGAFRSLVADAVHTHVPAVNESVLTAMLEHVHYYKGEYDSPDDFTALAKILKNLEKRWSGIVRLMYFSVPPSVFSAVGKNLCKGGVHTPEIPLRCIVEKPVGNDQESFQAIRDALIGCFREEEIYLLDHYLGKEAVRNIYYLRYANPVVETLLANALIHHVEITSFEAAGIEGRAGYFEHAGTLRDMFQSHMLMVASLLTMPLVETEQSIPKSRFGALKQFYLPPAKNLNTVILQGQYDAGEVHSSTVPAYQEEEGVATDSRTNTFIALKLLSRASRWQGVPFYLRSGKRLEKKETRISIQFQEPTEVGEGANPNCLHIILQGEAGMRLHLQTKMGGTNPSFRALVLADPLVCMGDCLPEHSLMILEAIHGKRHWFLSFNEVQTAWHLIDPLQAHLDEPTTALHHYPSGSKGPQEADAWITQQGVTWH